MSEKVPQAPAVPDPFAPGSLLIQVVLLNSAAVAGAEVTISQGELLSKAGVTDANGEITFKDLTPGDYAVKVVFPGHGLAPEVGKVVVGPVNGTHHVDPGPDVSTLQVVLAAPLLAFLRVKVHDEKLKPMAKVPVDIDVGVGAHKLTTSGFVMFGPLPAPGPVNILAGNTDFTKSPHFSLANQPPDAVIFERASSVAVLSEGRISDAVLQLAERKLEITKIDANFAPSVETCDITFAIKGLAKRKVVLTIEGENYPGKTIVQRDLTDPEGADGEHNVIAFTGKVEVGAEKDQFIHPLMGPFKVRLEHVDAKNLGILKSEKPFKVLYHSIALAFGKHVPDETTPDKAAEQIKFVQAKLNELGFDAGPVTGTLDATTQGAIRRFERANYLPAATSPMPETGAITGNLLTVLESAAKRDLFEAGKTPLTQDARFYVYDNFMCDRDNDIALEWASPGPPAQTGRIPTGNLAQSKGMNRAPASEDKMERAFIPLEIEVKLKNKAGAAVSAPKAVGPVPVAFEVKDETEDDSHITANPKAKTYIQHAREIGTMGVLAGAPRIDGSGDNAPVTQGGFRPVLLADYIKVWCPDGAGSKLAPFAVAKYDTETRGATTFDRAIVNAFRHPSDFPKRLGRAGLYLRMSTKGGDDCKVRVSLSFKGLPNQADLEKDHPTTNKELVKETGKWTVWRRTRFSAYCAQTVGSRLPATPQWNAVRDIWKDAFLEVENNGQPLQILSYSTIVPDAEYRKAIMALPAAGQPNGGVNPATGAAWQSAQFNYDPTALYGGPYPPIPQPPGPPPAVPPAATTNAFSGYQFYTPAPGSGEDAQNYVTRAGNFMILWVAPTFGPGVVNAMLSVLHKQARKTSPEGYVIFDYRVAQPISGQDWNPAANAGAGGFVPTTNPFARNQPTGHRGWVNADGAVTMNLDNGYNVDEYVAHECGHARFLYHHAFTNSPPTNASGNPTLHDLDQLDCTMSYAPPGTPGNHTAFRFCGKCLLRLRGWDVPSLPQKYA